MPLYRLKMQNGLQLAITQRPRGGDWLCDEMRALAAEGIDTVVSLLEDGESEELGLANEQAECESAGIRFLNFPIQDRSVPRLRPQFKKFVEQLVVELRRGCSVAIHCRMGIGRSTLLAACVLVSAGVDPENAWLIIQTARGCSVPDTHEQRDFVQDFKIT